MTRPVRPSILLLALVACRPAAPIGPTATPAPAPTEVPADAAPEAPDAVLAALEARLLGAERVHLVFEVESHGAIETDVRGILVVGPGGRALLEAQGTFAGATGVARLECDGKQMRGTSGTARLELPCPAGLGPALLLGLVRMGVLHNVARAWSAKAPDRADAEPDAAPSAAMDAWVTTARHHRPPATLPERAATHFETIAFDVVVDGTPVGDAALHLDADGNPTSREQSVRFPGADPDDVVEMKVVERYEAVEITRRP
ncbi:MAG: hypothetical protein JNK45_04150 [Myxococcales bacterium]|nr:hypothetical protein [Myxococcales bacterium]